MEITTQALYDYMHCPMFYYLKYIKKLKMEPDVDMLFDKQMHKAVLSFYFHIMNGKLVSEEDIKKKWNQLWAKHLTVEEIMTREFKNKQRIYQLRGVKMLLTHYRRVVHNPGMPICVDEQFRVPIGDHMVTGSWDLVRCIRRKKEETDIVDFKMDYAKPSWYMIYNDVNLSIQTLAFRTLFGVKEDHIIYHYLGTGNDIGTKRDEDSFRQLEKIINNMAACVEQGLFYPRQAVECKHCRFAKECYQWGK